MQRLTDREEETMEKIWQIGPCSPKDVQALYDEPQPHINTVATMFQALEKKGYLSHKAVGRGYVYYPEVEREDYGKSKILSLTDRMFSGSCMSVVSALVQAEKVTEAELLQYLADLRK